MPRVFFTDNLKRHMACPDTDVSGGTVRAALDAVFDTNPPLKSYLLDDQGRLRRHVNIFVGNRMIDDRDGLSDTVREDEEIYVFQALSGG
ncbi:MAG: hypothetical protein WD407_00010 [Rhodospirillales bacterium]